MTSGADVAANLQPAGALIAEAAEAGASLVAAAGEFRVDGPACARQARGAGARRRRRAAGISRADGTRAPAVRDRRKRADRLRRSDAHEAVAARLRSRRRAARAIRQDPSVPLHARRRGLRRSEDDRRRRRSRRRFAAPCGRVGLSICYDLRFPELYRALGDVALLVVPAAFTARTGERTGKRCCARARSRTSVTCSPPRRAASTRRPPDVGTFDARRSVGRDRCRRRPKARASSSATWIRRASTTCARNCRRCRIAPSRCER